MKERKYGKINGDNTMQHFHQYILKNYMYKYMKPALV